VPRDFVEFPSQVNEMWATWPEVVESYAVHYQTGERMPRELVDRVLALETFNQGFATTEYLAAAIVDQALHQLGPEEVPAAEELMEFEADVLRRASADLRAVPPRYRVPYFSHIFTGYSAAYYSYIWAEVLDADAVEWFKENGGLRRQNGDHFRAALLSRGGSEDELELYRAFRGRDADVGPLLARRGLSPGAN
jgi:peptidyl-dipeptidase Dcp